MDIIPSNILCDVSDSFFNSFRWLIFAGYTKGSFKSLFLSYFNFWWSRNVHNPKLINQLLWVVDIYILSHSLKGIALFIFDSWLLIWITIKNQWTNGFRWNPIDIFMKPCLCISNLVQFSSPYKCIQSYLPHLRKSW